MGLRKGLFDVLCVMKVKEQGVYFLTVTISITRDGCYVDLFADEDEDEDI